MKFTATQFPLAVDHKLKGKLYNADPFQEKTLPKGAATSAPFDSHIVLKGESWELPPDAKLIGVRELRGAATPQGGTPD